MRYLSVITLAIVTAWGSYSAAADTPSAPKCMNATCPVSGKVVDPSIPMTQFNSKMAPGGKATNGQMVGFCCPKCQVTYDADQKKYEDGLTKQMNTKN
jgi:hypothetical protein